MSAAAIHYTKIAIPCFHLFEGLNWTARQSTWLWLTGYTYREDDLKALAFVFVPSVFGEKFPTAEF
jgi:hypothetical protein